MKRIPTGIPELDKALQGGLVKGSMSLVAGNPGTGKTLLCGAFLYKGTMDGEKTLYVSLSEGRQSFLAYMKQVGCDFEAEPLCENLHIMDLVSLKEEGLDALMEMITEHIDEHGTQRLVVDSFTAITNAFKETIDARVALHILSKILNHSECTSMLVTEIPTGSDRMGLGVEEFVADGIITLTRRSVHSTLVRELEINKMRGTLIEQPTHVFTLNNGFNLLPRFRPKEQAASMPYTPPPEAPSHYSTGNQQLDRITGQLRQGSTLYIEQEENITPEVTRLLLGPMKASFIAQGRAVLTVPPAGENVQGITCFDAKYSHDKDWYNTHMMIASNTENSQRLQPILNVFPTQDSPRQIRDAVKDMINRTKQPMLKVIHTGNAENLWPTAKTNAILSAESMHTRQENSLMVLVSRPGNMQTRLHSANLADTHIRIINHKGAVLLQGVNPRTPFYALEQCTENGYPDLKYTPIH